MNLVESHGPAVRTTCPYCGVGCGLLAQADGRGGAAIAADPTHPANFGRICSKGAALGETIGLGGRLLHPMVRQPAGALTRVTWDTALHRVASEFSDIIARHGPEAVAFYLSGQLLTEDYYVANKLMKGFIGSANVDTNSRLCMASSVAGHRRAFGADTVPGIYADLDEADLLVLVGSNTAWCHPVLFQRMVANKTKRGARIVVIDPRRTTTADEADLFLSIAPGTDAALFSGLLVQLVERRIVKETYVASHTAGLPAALTAAREIAPSVADTARATGLSEEDVASFFNLFCATARVVTCYSQGVNQSAQGTDKVNAIINCHLATGRIGRPGMGPFSLTGQPNAMGGREVGGLANQLAAHMGFSPREIDRVRRFWKAPRMAEREGHKAVQMFQAIERGEIKALWVMATNPAVSLPRASAVRAALGKLDLLVVSENVSSNDTVNAGAHVLLPAAAWGEKDGTVTNSERCISRQRAFLPPAGESKPDWWIICQIARRLGFADEFSHQSAADVFREHAALSAFENDGERDFDLGALAVMSDEGYDVLEPVHWPRQMGEGTAERRFFSTGGFFTPDRKARFIAIERPELRERVCPKYPLRLNTGRIRDQWHSMTRSGLSPRLASHLPEPFVEVHPDDARRYDISDGGFARVSTAHGACVLKVIVSESQQPGSLFVPIHWSGETASSARIGDLVAAQTDPHSGQPEAKATPAAIAPVVFASRGFSRTRDPVALPDGIWWARVAIAGGTEFRLAADHGPMIWHDFASRCLAHDGKLAERYEGSRYHAAVFVDGEIDACICLGPADLSLQDEALVFDAADMVDGSGRQIARVSRTALGETEPVICACLGVSTNILRDAVARGSVRTLAEIGKAFRAGTQCGSCLPELKRIIREHVANTG